MASYISLGPHNIIYDILKKYKYDVRENFVFNNIITGNCTKLFYPNKYVYNIIKNFSIKNINNLISYQNYDIIQDDNLKNIYSHYNIQPILTNDFLYINNTLTDLYSLKKQLSNIITYFKICQNKIIFVRFEYSYFDIEDYINFVNIITEININIDFEIKIIYFDSINNINNIDKIKNNIYIYDINKYINNLKPDLLFNQYNLKEILDYNKKILIIQTSPQRTASTLLVNILYGLFNETYNKKIYCEWTSGWKYNFRNIFIIKTHNLNIDELIQKYSNYYNVYIYCSERKNLNLFIDDTYYDYENLFKIEYNELLETETNKLNDIISNVYSKIEKMVLNNNLKCNIENAIERIKKMNLRQKEIQLLPFDYIDDFFEIHGSHRNRNI